MPRLVSSETFAAFFLPSLFIRFLPLAHSHRSSSICPIVFIERLCKMLISRLHFVERTSTNNKRCISYRSYEQSYLPTFWKRKIQKETIHPTTRPTIIRSNNNIRMHWNRRRSGTRQIPGEAIDRRAHRLPVRSINHRARRSKRAVLRG